MKRKSPETYGRHITTGQDLTRALYIEATKMNKEINHLEIRFIKEKRNYLLNKITKAKKKREVLIVMAELNIDDKLPILLQKITTRHVLDTVLKSTTFPKATYYYDERQHLRMAELDSTELVLKAKELINNLPKERMLKRFAARFDKPGIKCDN